MHIANSLSLMDAIYFAGYDHTPARLALAEAAIQTAFRLRPDAGEAHFARAVNLYWGYLDYEGALNELAIVRQTHRNDARVFEWQGTIERRQGAGRSRHETWSARSSSTRATSKSSSSSH